MNACGVANCWARRILATSQTPPSVSNVCEEVRELYPGDGPLATALLARGEEVPRSPEPGGSCGNSGKKKKKNGMPSHGPPDVLHNIMYSATFCAADGLQALQLIGNEIAAAILADLAISPGFARSAISRGLALRARSGR